MAQRCLEDLRKKIDEIDEEIVALIDKRARIVKNIAKYKKEKGLSIFQNEREKEVYSRVSKLSKELSSEEITYIYRSIIKVFKEIQKRDKTA